ncbi:GNAT family N-acetyltransferase [Jatrophihabitans sp. YIM 134969]
MITLRMFTEAELVHFDADKRGDDPYNFFGFRNGNSVRRSWAESGLVSTDDSGGTLAVDLDGDVVGDVGWHPVRYGPPPTPVAYNIGISLVPAQRGKGYGSLAQRELGDYLFGVYAVHRLEASTDVSNIAEQRALAKAGFTREGVLRGAQFRGGRFRDLVQFSRLRDDNPDATA